MSESQGRTSEVSRFVATVENTRMEMRRNWHLYIVGLPRTKDGYDSIWVIVDRLTKVANFIPVKTTYTGAKLAEFIYPGLSVYMGYLRRLCLTEVLNSRLGFGRNCMSQWIRS